MTRTSPSQDNGRRSMVSVRLSPEEEVALKTEAAQQGETLSQFIRDVLLRRAHAAVGVADVRLYPTSSTVVTVGMALEAEEGRVVPRTPQTYVSPLLPGATSH